MGAVVAFRPVEALSPHLVTVFCVQAYWRDRAKLARGRWREFVSMEAALRAGRAEAGRAPAVVVYRMRGNPQVDYWEEPIILATHGEAAQARRDGTLEPIRR